MKKIGWIVCVLMLFSTGALLSEADTPSAPNIITLAQTNPTVPQEVGAIALQNTDSALIQINKDNPQPPLIDIEKKKKPRYFDAQSEENIFGVKEFKKTFDTGIIKDVKIVGGHNMVYQAWSQSNGVSHNWMDDRVSLWGVQGSFRDGTMYNITAIPFMEHVPNYPNSSNRLFEYYLKKKVGNHHYITLGQQRTPNTYEGCRSVFGLPIGRRAQLGNTYSNIVSIGAKVSGDYDRIEYQAGIFDAGRFMKDVFYYSPEFATLVSFKPIKNTEKYGKLKVGGSVNHGRRESDYNVYSAHALYDYKKAHIDFEYAKADGYSSRSVSKNKSDSYYATFIYKLSPRWEPFCRVDTLNANTQVSGQRNTEYSVGTHYYLKGKKMRLTVSYIYANHEKRPDSSKLFTMLEILM